MSEANQNRVPNTKKVILNLAAGYAIIVPAVFVIYILLTMEVKTSLRVSPLLAVSFLISSFVVGILLSMFGRSLGVGLRALVFVGTLMSGVLGGILALALWYLYGLKTN
jgi:hypothetical protein